MQIHECQYNANMCALVPRQIELVCIDGLYETTGSIQSCSNMLVLHKEAKVSPASM